MNDTVAEPEKAGLCVAIAVPETVGVRVEDEVTELQALGVVEPLVLDEASVEDVGMSEEEDEGDGEREEVVQADTVEVADPLDDPDALLPRLPDAALLELAEPENDGAKDAEAVDVGDNVTEFVAVGVAQGVGDSVPMMLDACTRLATAETLPLPDDDMRAAVDVALRTTEGDTDTETPAVGDDVALLQALVVADDAPERVGWADRVLAEEDEEVCVGVTVADSKALPERTGVLVLLAVGDGVSDEVDARESDAEELVQLDADADAVVQGDWLGAALAVGVALTVDTSDTDAKLLPETLAVAVVDPVAVAVGHAETRRDCVSAIEPDCAPEGEPESCDVKEGVEVADFPADAVSVADTVSDPEALLPADPVAESVDAAEPDDSAENVLELLGQAEPVALGGAERVIAEDSDALALPLEASESVGETLGELDVDADAVDVRVPEDEDDTVETPVAEDIDDAVALLVSVGLGAALLEGCAETLADAESVPEAVDEGVDEEHDDALAVAVGVAVADEHMDDDALSVPVSEGLEDCNDEKLAPEDKVAEEQRDDRGDGEEVGGPAVLETVPTTPLRDAVTLLVEVAVATVDAEPVANGEPAGATLRDAAALREANDAVLVAESDGAALPVPPPLEGEAPLLLERRAEAVGNAVAVVHGDCDGDKLAVVLSVERRDAVCVVDAVDDAEGQEELVDDPVEDEVTLGERDTVTDKVPPMPSPFPALDVERNVTLEDGVLLPVPVDDPDTEVLPDLLAVTLDVPLAEAEAEAAVEPVFAALPVGSAEPDCAADTDAGALIELRDEALGAGEFEDDALTDCAAEPVNGTDGVATEVPVPEGDGEPVAVGCNDLDADSDTVEDEQGDEERERRDDAVLDTDEDCDICTVGDEVGENAAVRDDEYVADLEELLERVTEEEVDGEGDPEELAVLDIVLLNTGDTLTVVLLETVKDTAIVTEEDNVGDEVSELVADNVGDTLLRRLPEPLKEAIVSDGELDAEEAAEGLSLPDDIGDRDMVPSMENQSEDSDVVAETLAVDVRDTCSEADGERDAEGELEARGDADGERDPEGEPDARAECDAVAQMVTERHDVIDIDGVELKEAHATVEDGECEPSGEPLDDRLAERVAHTVADVDVDGVVDRRAVGEDVPATTVDD